MVCSREAEGWPYIAHASDRLSSSLSRQAKPRAQGGVGADWILIFSARMLHTNLFYREYTYQSVGVPYIYVSVQIDEVQNTQDPNKCTRGSFSYRGPCSSACKLARVA